MFYCENTKCKKLSKPGEKPRRLVVETRERIYTRTVKDKGKDKEITLGCGWEIVREASMCAPCAEGMSHDQ
jgi:hypothetical protein